ncbi:uncharacterized protein LOC144732523 [Lampetra planeri]
MNRFLKHSPWARLSRLADLRVPTRDDEKGGGAAVRAPPVHRDPSGSCGSRDVSAPTRPRGCALTVAVRRRRRPAELRQDPEELRQGPEGLGQEPEDSGRGGGAARGVEPPGARVLGSRWGSSLMREEIVDSTRAARTAVARRPWRVERVPFSSSRRMRGGLGVGSPRGVGTPTACACTSWPRRATFRASRRPSTQPRSSCARGCGPSACPLGPTPPCPLLGPPPASPRPRLLVELTAVEAADVEALMELFSRPPWRPVAQLDLRHRCQQQQQHLRHQQHLLHRRSLFSDQQELDNYDFKQQTQSYRFHQQQHNLHQQHDQHLAAVDDDGDQQQLAGLSRRCRCPYCCRFFSLGDLDSPAWVIRVPCRCAAAKQDPSLHRHPHHHQQHHHQQDHHHHLEQPTAVLLYVLPCGPGELGPLARFYGLLLDGGSAALPNPGCCWSRELSAGPGLRVQLLLRADEAVPAGPPTPAPCAHLEVRVPALAALPCQRRARLLRLSGVRWQAEDPSGRTLLLLLQNAFVTPPLQTRRSLPPRGLPR